MSEEKSFSDFAQNKEGYKAIPASLARVVPPNDNWVSEHKSFSDFAQNKEGKKDRSKERKKKRKIERERKKEIIKGIPFKLYRSLLGVQHVQD